MPLRLAFGSSGSGTQAVTAALLDANRIDPTQLSERWQALGGRRAADALIAGELDAAFFLGPAENSLIQRLAAEPTLRLAGLRRTEAYLARLPYLSQLQVGEGMLDMAQNTPTATSSPSAPSPPWSPVRAFTLH